ncbi:MAG: tRNA (cytidine(34)-2'-O)-methyltransferase [Desulfobacterales bacterium]|nr:tRNA (cytidine(34)-2'-O)-methyltransferase [Desulfobacterales bacterium]
MIEKTRRQQVIERHVVLVAPEVHWNTGNIGRTCLGAGARLHLIRPLGFSLEARQVKRAGLDYWSDVPLWVWDNFADFSSAMAPAAGQVALFSKTAPAAYWRMPRPERLFLVFGSETRGLPDSILKMYPGRTYHIPITNRIRSLNLSTAVGIALYESLREVPPVHCW